jgi:hypothetical protein
VGCRLSGISQACRIKAKNGFARLAPKLCRSPGRSGFSSHQIHSDVADARASIGSLNGRCALQHCALNSTAYIPVSGCRRHGAAGVAKCGE